MANYRSEKHDDICIANENLSSAQSLGPNGYAREELAVKKYQVV